MSIRHFMIGLLVQKLLAAAMLRRLVGLAGVTVLPAFTYTSNEEGRNRQPHEHYLNLGFPITDSNILLTEQDIDDIIAFLRLL